MLYSYKASSFTFLDTPKAHLLLPDAEFKNAVAVSASLIEMQLSSSSWIHHQGK